MDILFLLVPLSVLLVLALLGVFAWAVHARQFEDLDREGERILETDTTVAPETTGRSEFRSNPEQA